MKRGPTIGPCPVCREPMDYGDLHPRDDDGVICDRCAGNAHREDMAALADIRGVPARDLTARTRALHDALNAARDGDRLVLLTDEQEKRLWSGLGNRAGLHGFASELLRERWTKSGDRLLRKLARLPAGARVEVRVFRNMTRDRGRWRTDRTITL